MKNYIQIVAVALGVGLATIAPSVQAQTITETENYKLTTYTQEEISRVWVKVSKTAGTKFHLAVKSASGNVLFNEVLSRKTKQHAFRIDLADAENGVYYIETTDGKTPICKIVRKESITATEPVVAQRVVAMN